MPAARLLLLAAGLPLTAANLFGLWASAAQDIPERKPEPPDGEGEWLTAPVEQRSGEPDDSYFRRLTMSIHYRITPSLKSYVVPVHENWLLFAARYVLPSYRQYEYSDYRRAIERGAGVCTQHAAAIFDVLKRQGFKRRIFGFPRHVVVEAEARDGRTFVLDGYYGVVMPMSIEEIRRRPAAVGPYHGGLDPARTPVPTSSERAEWVYGMAPLFVLARESTPRRAYAERVAYRLKWPLPLALCLGAARLARPR